MRHVSNQFPPVNWITAEQTLSNNDFAVVLMKRFRFKPNTCSCPKNKLLLPVEYFATPGSGHVPTPSA